MIDLVGICLPVADPDDPGLLKPLKVNLVVQKLPKECVPLLFFEIDKVERSENSMLN